MKNHTQISHTQENEPSIFSRSYRKLKRRIWNKRLVLWWHKLWVRRDEFHKSLDMNAPAMLEMNKKERSRYIADLVRRREIAHQRSMEKTN
jgi:hypothetical protein